MQASVRGNPRLIQKVAKRMSKKEVTYLIFNFPFCFFLFVALIVFDQALNYNFSNWNPQKATVIVSISLIILISDFIIMGLLKIITVKMALLTLLEFLITYLILSAFLNIMI
jgi:hypothetical protein